MKFERFKIVFVVCIGVLLMLVSCSTPKEQEQSIYQHEQTKKLVSFVNNAVKLVEKEGEASFPEFRKKNSKWYQDDFYVFIYDTEGNRIVYPPAPQKEGENAFNVTDVDGKHQVQMFINKALTEPGEGWVHYKWPKPGESTSVLKYTFVKKAQTSSGKILVLCAGYYPEENELQILTEDYPPLTFEKDGKITGFGTEVVREILRKLNIPDNIRILPWEEAYNLCLKNPNVVLFTMKRTELRENLFQWIGPIGSNNTIFYAKKGSGIQINSMDDAKKVSKIATCSAWFSEQDLKDTGFTNLVSSPLPIENVRQLAEGEVDLSIFTDITIPEIAIQAGYSIDDLEPVFTVSTGYFYIAISKTTPQSLVDLWKQAFQAMYEDGTFKRIYAKWIPNGTIPVL